MKCCNPHPPPCHRRRCPRTPHTPRAARPAPPAPRPGRREETRAALRTAASAPLPPPSCQGPPRPGRAAPPGPRQNPVRLRPRPGRPAGRGLAGAAWKFPSCGLGTRQGPALKAFRRTDQNRINPKARKNHRPQPVNSRVNLLG